MQRKNRPRVESLSAELANMITLLGVHQHVGLELASGKKSLVMSSDLNEYLSYLLETNS